MNRLLTTAKPRAQLRRGFAVLARFVGTKHSLSTLWPFASQSDCGQTIATPRFGMSYERPNTGGSAPGLGLLVQV